MSEPFIGEINFFAFDFPPKNWMLCDGSLLPIAQYQALFSLLGTQFGGDGQTTFAVPDLRGRTPMHPGANTPQGAKAGEESVTLTPAQLPQHNHPTTASSALGTQKDYEGALFAAPSGTSAKLYAAPASVAALNPGTVSPTGESQSHPNCQPSLVGNYCIAIAGVFPPHN